MNDSTDNHAPARISALTAAILAASGDEDLTRLHIERGHWHELLGDDANSVRDYLSALDTASTKSDIVHIRSMIALTLAKKDQKEQAIFWAMSAVDQNPQSAEGFHTLGLVCDVCGFLNLAVESLHRALQLEPDRWDSLRLLGSCLRENGQLQEAVETLTRYVVLQPAEPLGLYELAWTIHIGSLGDVDKVQKAKELYEKALQYDPSTNLRAMIERKLRDLQSASWQ